MNRERLRTAVSLAEIVSALAVVVTLIYAAGELRRSRLLTSVEVEAVLYDRIREMDREHREVGLIADVVSAVGGSADAGAARVRPRRISYRPG